MGHAAQLIHKIMGERALSGGLAGQSTQEDSHIIHASHQISSLVEIPGKAFTHSEFQSFTQNFIVLLRISEFLFRISEFYSEFLKCRRELHRAAGGN